MDGKDFVGFAVKEVWEKPFPPLATKPTKAKPGAIEPKAPVVLPPARERSRLIDHFVMNLPDSAITFLSHYRGIYKPLWHNTDFRKAVEDKNTLPLVHCYCFTRFVEGGHEEDIRQVNLDPYWRILPVGADKRFQRATEELRHPVGPELEDFGVHYVRSVAPNKDMYRLTFRLPLSVLLDEAAA